MVLQTDERVRLLREAGATHVRLYRDAMCGMGIDRHIFALYIVKRYLEVPSAFLETIMPRLLFKLSTSQTPMQQVAGVNLLRSTANATAGGGFGPVTADGYGVSYSVVGEHLLGFHISSKPTAPNTVGAMDLRS